ncbi:MAG: hypothetical protein JJE02_11145, partial [Propionibacteriales bacterium]|nr:hypothetical protein [Propionibacteriales bacterium]
HHTREVLDAIDRFGPEYEELIRTPRRQGPMALLERMGVVGPFGDADSEFEDLDFEFDEANLPLYMLDRLTRAVGDRKTLDHLDAAPLPDEEFDWSQLPDDIRRRVEEVLALVDDVTETHLDLEYRTACRRLLRDVAAGDAEIFRRKSSSARTAAAICWMAAKANESVGYAGSMSTQDFLAHFGITGSVSQRTEVMQRAIGADPQRQYGSMDLGTTAYLVSTRRARIMEARDRYVARLGDA